MTNIIEWVAKLLGLTNKTKQLIIKYNALKAQVQPIIDLLGPDAQALINEVDAEVTAILAEEG